jgi:DNA-binding transcriptional LysR family regulator
MSTDSLSPVVADLHLLTVLAQTRSFTETARRLGISKASASGRITELEKKAGVPLVRRTTRSVGLTPAGEQLVADMQPAFDRISEGLAAVRDLADTPSGLIRVTAPVALGRQHLAPALAPFLERYSDIHIELELTDRLINLSGEGFDLAIRHTDTPPDTHIATLLCETRAALVASPKYLRRRGTPNHPDELSQHDCVLYRGPTSSGDWRFTGLSGAGPLRAGPLRAGQSRAASSTASASRRKNSDVVNVRVSGRFKANNSEVLRDAIVGGMGIGLLPDFSAQPASGRSTLVRVLPDWEVQGYFGTHIYAIRPPTVRVPKAVQFFVEHLRQTMRNGFPEIV